jgi:hypothetical protein
MAGMELAGGVAEVPPLVVTRGGPGPVYAVRAALGFAWLNESSVRFGTGGPAAVVQNRRISTRGVYP